jgi:hypothetical protein
MKTDAQQGFSRLLNKLQAPPPKFIDLFYCHCCFFFWHKDNKFFVKTTSNQFFLHPFQKIIFFFEVDSLKALVLCCFSEIFE